ncbi:NUDIX hydrolase [Kingella potus]|uniref:NUDIX hydrolase n=1 Tax=Kingella potus TaxID=265175 RepID=UPI001FD2CB16|nr:NUDIX domain-containing protein [Kingella potus]UOP00635.1 NUDIX domain-containing protein [Kingella potus]
MNTAPLPDSVQNALLAFLQNTFRHRLQDTHPLLLNGIPLGRLTASWRQRLQQDWTGRLQARADGLLLETDSWHDMAAMLQETARRWHEAGYFGGWRGEQCDVHDGGGHLLFTLERSAFRPLGLASRAVHINGCCETPAGLRFWIARRSPHKAVDPGKLDNLTGGGIAAGETSVCAMYRETWEEAGIPPDTAAAAHPAECLFSSHPVRRGLHREYLHIFDLRLPHGFTPQNQDGEVASFSLMTVPKTPPPPLCRAK